MEVRSWTPRTECAIWLDRLGCRFVLFILRLYGGFNSDSGTTVCLGQRLARLSLKLITVMMLLEMDFNLVDRRSGRLPELLPQPNWNDTLTCKPPLDTRFMKFERKKGVDKS